MEPKFDNLLDLFKAHIDTQIAQQVEIKFNERMNAETNKEYYHVKEISQITGLTVDAIKGRRKRGTLELVNDGNVLLMHKDELSRILKKLDCQRVA